MDDNQNIQNQLIIYAGLCEGEYQPAPIVKHGLLILSPYGITFATKSQRKRGVIFYLSLIVAIVAVILYFIFHYPTVIIFIFVLFLALGEFWIALSESSYSPRLLGKFQKYRNRVETEGLKLVKQLDWRVNYIWEEIKTVSFKSSECRLILGLKDGEKHEYHLYTDKFIGNHPECLLAIDPLKKYLTKYLPEEKKRW